MEISEWFLTAGMMAKERKKEDTCGNAGGTSQSACAREISVQQHCRLVKDSRWRPFDPVKKTWEENGIDAL